MKKSSHLRKGLPPLESYLFPFVGVQWVFSSAGGRDGDAFGGSWGEGAFHLAHSLQGSASSISSQATVKR